MSDSAIRLLSAASVLILLASPAVADPVEPEVAGVDDDAHTPKVPLPPERTPAKGSADPSLAKFGLTAPANVNVSRATGNQSEISTAVNPTNPLNMVVFSNTNTNAIFRGYSLNGGATWTTGNVFSACCDAQGVFDDYGNLFVTYIDSSYRIRAAMSTDGGATFPTDRIVGTGSVDQPSIAVGPGSVWVDWNASGSMVATGAPVTGLGAWGAFGATQSIPSAAGSFGGVAAVGPSGKVMVVYQDRTGTQGPATIYANVDPDGLGPSPFGARITITSTNVGGFDYIPCQNDRSIDAEAGLAWDSTGGPYAGRVYLIYTDETTNENHDTDIKLRFSDDSGATWSEPVRVNDDATTRSQFLPTVSLDRTVGVVAVGFYDARNDGGVLGNGSIDNQPNNDAMYFGTYSCDGGATFAPNIQISAGTSKAAWAGSSVDYGDYVNSDFYGDSYRAAWADNSNTTADNPAGTLSTFDLYTAGVPFSCAIAGDRAWLDTDEDGIQDPGEPGVAGAQVSLYTGAGALVASATSSASGSFAFSGLVYGASYNFRVTPPNGLQITLRDQGSDDETDSDVYSNRWSPTFPLAFGPDAARWDVGLVPCRTPALAPVVPAILKEAGGMPKLTFTDANAPLSLTGWNVLRSTSPDGGFTAVATNAGDQDGTASGNQWTDSAATDPVYYYDVVAWNAQCGTQGPR